jgi:hypothetical protein
VDTYPIGQLIRRWQWYAEENELGAEDTDRFTKFLFWLTKCEVESVIPLTRTDALPPCCPPYNVWMSKYDPNKEE